MAVYRCRAKGHLPGGEIFVFGVHVQGAGGEAQQCLTAWSSAITAFWGTGTLSISNQYSNLMGIDVLDAAELDATNSRQLTRFEAEVALPGGSSAPPLPNQVALVVSLRTALATRSGRGRFFLPGPIINNSINARVTGTFQTLIAEGAQQLLTAMFNGGFSAVVYRSAKHPPGQPGNITVTPQATAVTTIDVGDVWDTQRRRRNRLIEVRAPLPLP